MSDWSNWLVILVVAAAAGWCIRWVRGVWSRRGTLCACDRGSCPTARKLETVVKTSAGVQGPPSEDKSAGLVSK